MNQTESSPNESGPRAAITVLLIDDQPFVGVAIKRLLAPETDMDVHCCHAAEEALEMAGVVRPTLILQDLVMPGIDGLTLVASFRNNLSTTDTPIIVLSGNDDPTSRERALAAGANEYLMKLPARKDLIACIRRHATGVGRSTSAAERTSLESSAAMECRLDPQVIADIAGASAAFANELVDLFILDARGRVESLSSALDARDREALRNVAHALKGASGTVGARRLATMCQTLEQLATAAEDFGAADALVTGITNELDALVAVFADAKLGTIRDARGAA
jgi:CheY-like chemotaxis protein